MALNPEEGQKKIDAVKDFYLSLGIDTLAKEAVNSYYTEALDSLKKLDLTPEQMERMEAFASSLVSRNK